MRQLDKRSNPDYLGKSTSLKASQDITLKEAAGKVHFNSTASLLSCCSSPQAKALSPHLYIRYDYMILPSSTVSTYSLNAKGIQQYGD